MSEESSENKNPSEPRPEKAKGWGVFAGTFWAVVAFLGPQFATAPLFPFIAGLTLSNNVKLFTLHAFIELITLAILFTVIHAYGLKSESIGLKKFKLQHFNWAVLALPFYFLCSFVIVLIAGSFLPSELLEQPQNIGFTGGNPLELILIFIALVLVTPFVEEVIFRGFLLRAYQQKFNSIVAIIAVSALFAAAHGQVNVGIDVFILSLVLCYIRIKSNSLWPPIVLHSLKNFIAFFLLFIIGVK